MLVLAALANFSAYYTYDSIATIADILRLERGFSEKQIGWLNAVYSLPNIPLSLIGGLLIDRIGTGRAALMAATLCCCGAMMTALGDPYALMVAGRLVFGAGSETLYIALLVGLAQWFAGGHGALAMALFFSVARVGSYLADTSPRWAGSLYAAGWQAPLWLAGGLCVGGWVCAMAYWLLDRAAARPTAPRVPASSTEHGLVSGLQQMWRQVRGLNRSFWHILWLNVLFASFFFPFRSTFSIQYFQQARGLSLSEAGMANSWVFFAAIIATPLWGLVADRYGRRASLLALGAALMPVNFLLLATDVGSLWISTALMGISFSVIPAVIWPATAMLVEKPRLGAAYGLINLLQSLGLVASNEVAGWLNDRFHAGPANPAGYTAMFVWFGTLAVVATACALALALREWQGAGHGLERAGAPPS